MCKTTQDQKMEEQKGAKKGKKPPAKKGKVLKVGGLWVDSSSFPALDDNEEPESSPHR